MLPSTLAAATCHETIVKKSRFIALLSPVSTTEAADAVIATVRKEHWDARHHCTAMVIGARGELARSSDDGEPAGTAGAPMLQVLRHRPVTDLVAVVTRYFGGVLLGTGGLARAYAGAVSAALDEAELLRRAELRELRLTVPHTEAGRLHGLAQSWCARHDGLLAEVSYRDEAEFLLLVRPGEVPDAEAMAAAASAGVANTRLGDLRVVELPAVSG